MYRLTTVIATTLVLCLLAVPAQAQWFYDPAPNRTGHGINLTHDSGQGSAVYWFLYDRQGEATWLMSTEPCQAFPCQIDLAEAAGTWMGGDFELVPVGEALVDTDGETLTIRYDLRFWPAAGDCRGTPGGILFKRCAGNFNMVRLD